MAVYNAFGAALSSASARRKQERQEKKQRTDEPKLTTRKSRQENEQTSDLKLSTSKPSSSSGEERYQPRQSQVQQANKDYKSNLFNMFGMGLAAQEAAGMPEQTELARYQRDYGVKAQEANQRSKELNKAADWEGRDELITRYREAQALANEDVTKENMDRANALREELERRDIAAGNGARSYTGQDRFSNIFQGSLGGAASGLVNAAGTIGENTYQAEMQKEANSLDQLRLDQKLGDDTRKAAEEALKDPAASEGFKKVEAYADRISETASKDLQKAKKGLNSLGQAGVDISSNVIQMGFDLATGAATGGNSLVPMFFRTFGSSAQEARQEGATSTQQFLYGLSKAAIEVGTEKIADGVAGIYGKGAADDITEELVRKLSNSDTGRTMLRAIFGAVGEGGEEVLSDLLSPVAELIYKDPSLIKVDPSEVLYDFLIGAAVGALGGGTSIVTGQDAQANAKLRMQDAMDILNNAQQTEAQTATQTEEAAPADTAPTAEAPAETTPGMPMAQTVVNRSQANKIINDPAQRAAFEAETGIKLPGKKSEAARVVMDYYAQQAAEAQAAETAPAEETQTEPFMQEAMPENPTEAIEQAEADRQFAQQTYNVPQSMAGATINAPGPQTVNGQTAVPTAQTAATAAQPTMQGPRGQAKGLQPLAAPGTAGTNLSQAAETLKNSPVTSQAFAAEVDQAIANGDYRYLPVPNNQTANDARAYIEYEGWDKARAEWTAAVRQGKNTAELNMIGFMLYNNANNSGDGKAAAEIMRDLVMMRSNAGRSLQIARALAAMQPETRLYMLERSVEAFWNDFKGSLPEGSPINDALRQEFLNSKTEAERNAVIEKIIEDIAKQTPVTWRGADGKISWRNVSRKWTALRYLNMLGNFRTQVRNVGGNFATSMLYTAKNSLQAPMEWFLNKASGGKYQRQTSLVANPQLVNAARAYYKANADAINGEGKYSDDLSKDSVRRRIEEKQRIFTTPGIGTAMEFGRKATNKAMEVGDTVFIGARFARTLAGYLQANGMDAQTFSGIQDGSIKATDAQQTLIDNAVQYATTEAQEATFHDNNAFSDWISKIGRRKDTWTPAKLLAEGIMPFRKTPANVFARMYEYSPLGAVTETAKAIFSEKGEVTSGDLVNSIAKSLTGTGMMYLGMMLRNDGWLTGGEDDDEQKAFNNLTGTQQYALNLPDGTNITMDWLSPAAVPLFLGANLQDAIMDGGVEAKDLEKVLTNITEPLVSMSMMQGVNDTLDSIKYSENNLVQIALSSAFSYLTQGLTNTLMGQAERTFTDGKRSTTYVDRESAVPAWLQRSIGKAGEKIPIPGADFNQVEYVDAWGRTDDYSDNKFARALNNFVNPGYVSEDTSSKVDNELQRLYDNGQRNVFPDKIAQSYQINTVDKNGETTGNRYLTPDEYVTFQKVMGQTSLDMVSELMDSALYRRMSDDARAKAISEIYSYAKNRATMEVEPNTKPKDNAATLSNPAAYYGVKAAVSSATSSKYSRDYKSLDKVMKYYEDLPEDVRKELEDKNSLIGKLNEASKAGINSKAYFDMDDSIKAITPLEGHESATVWQKLETITGSDYSQDEIDSFASLYLNHSDKEGGMSTYEKYEACRTRGYSPKQVAQFYKIYNTTKGTDKNKDGKTDSGSKKKAVIQAAMQYGFSQKSAESLYKMWQGGKWK